MADPAPVLTSKDSAELAAYRARDEREKRIAADMAWRRDVCRGGIAENMLREMAEAQIAHDDREAAAAKK